MADLAVMFHWPPSEMAAFSLQELGEWRARGIARTQPEDHQ
jgi:hypothetical protein